ncbi:hypothetical protein NKH91_31810 [Mesorhizobium sp. M0894]|uniref:hypothetical protein n=1 Tax=unclassified Mesorhizobium TaxID=325217 RepID=UPI003336F614
MTEVKIDVTEDEERLFWHALIKFPQQLGSSPQLRLTITRKTSDTPYLGDAGWQASPATIEAVVVSRSANSATVAVSPEVCDNIRVDTKVRIEVDGHDVWGNAFWPPITPRPGNWGAGLTPPPKFTPIKKPSDDVIEKIVDPPQEEEEKPKDRTPPVQLPKKRRRYLYLLIPLVLLSAVGGYWIIPKPEPLIVKFERLKRTDSSGAELFALSGEAYQKGNAAIGLQAINLAMERGNKDAKLEVARWYDPGSFNPAKADRPDANKAARTYFELTIEGQTGAKELLRSLCAKSASSPQGPGFDGFLVNTYCEGTLE